MSEQQKLRDKLAQCEQQLEAYRLEDGDRLALGAWGKYIAAIYTAAGLTAPDAALIYTPKVREALVARCRQLVRIAMRAEGGAK